MTKELLNQLYEFCLIEKSRMGSYNERHLDIAFNAITTEELQHVIENTTESRVKTYAQAKLDFFTNKGKM